MSKFKEGDRVKRVTNDFGDCKQGNIYVVQSSYPTVITLEGINGYYDVKHFKLAEPEFKNGDEVEVRDSNLEHWKKGVYIGSNPQSNLYKHVVLVDDGFLEFIACRHKSKKEYTLKECADALGVPVEEFRIKDE